MREYYPELVCFSLDGQSDGSWLVLERRMDVGPQGCVLSYAPRVVLLNEPGLSEPIGTHCPGFVLEIRGGKARFGRSFSLPAELRGRGLGTYLLTGLIRRAVGLGFGDVPVHGLHLIKQQNSPLRNAFYQSMGFTLIPYRDGSGWARAPRLDVLRMHHDSGKVWEVRVGSPLQGGNGFC